MTIAALIRKREIGNLAIATPAISATQQVEAAGTVARIATVAVANPAQGQTANSAGKIGTSDEAAIRTWLSYIGETHQPTIDEVLHMCATGPTALTYYLSRADEVPRPAFFEDDHIACNQCANFIGAWCHKPSEGNPWRTVPDLSRRCVRFMPRAGDVDQRAGGERWPGLMEVVR